MTRVLLATDAVGGMWVYSVELARALRPLGVDAVLAVIGPPASEEQRRAAGDVRVIDTGLPLDWMPVEPGDLRRAGEEIARLADAEGMDIIQVGSAALLAGVEFRQPTVAVQHSCVATWWAAVRGTPLAPDFGWRRDIIEKGLKAAGTVIAPTAAFAAETERAYGLTRPVLAVHNGRRPAIAPSAPQSDFVFTASRLWDEGKNVATLDRAAARLPVSFEAAGPVAGPNGASASFAHLHLPGAISEAGMASILAKRPVFASSALYEPFGLSVLEAASAGCALVLSDIPTFRELWRNAAVFVPAYDDRGFAEIIALLFEDPEARETLGAAARARAHRYSPEAMAAKMADIYAGLLGTAQAAQPSLQLVDA